MSHFVNCQNCNCAIDTDSDPDCYVYDGNNRRMHTHKVMCLYCREDWKLKQEAWEQAESRAMTIAENCTDSKNTVE